jgi:hypothetical protein
MKLVSIALFTVSLVLCFPVVGQDKKSRSKKAKALIEKAEKGKAKAPFDLGVKSIPEKGKLAVFRPAFEKHVEVFGVLVVATADTSDAKVLHAGKVLAQYLDNDEDGKPDNPKVAANLRSRGAFLAMTARERDFRRLRLDWRKLERAGFELGQDLYGEETIPDGPPHKRKRGRFDASLEEVLHLVSHGYEESTPRCFVSELAASSQTPWTSHVVAGFVAALGGTPRAPGITMTTRPVTTVVSAQSISTGP